MLKRFVFLLLYYISLYKLDFITFWGEILSVTRIIYDFIAIFYFDVISCHIILEASCSGVHLIHRLSTQ